MLLLFLPLAYNDYWEANILSPLVYTAISRKVVGKIVDASILKGNMGYAWYTVPYDCSCRTYFGCFPLALTNTFPWPFAPILSNFSEEQWTQNYPQCLSGLSPALFPTTFLEKAVYINNIFVLFQVLHNS